MTGEHRLEGDRRHLVVLSDVHLGTDASPNACAIYELRGTTCREFEAGSWQCLEFRRELGVSGAR